MKIKIKQIEENSFRILTLKTNISIRQRKIFYRNLQSYFYPLYYICLRKIIHLSTFTEKPCIYVNSFSWHDLAAISIKLRVFIDKEFISSALCFDFGFCSCTCRNIYGVCVFMLHLIAKFAALQITSCITHKRCPIIGITSTGAKRLTLMSQCMLKFKREHRERRAIAFHDCLSCIQFENCDLMKLQLR